VKILVTGAAGQVGARLSQVLPALGETIVTQRETIDLAQPDTIRDAIRSMRPDVIVNAAAYTDVDRAESEPQLAHAVNAHAPGVIAEEAQRIGALLVHYSTDYVFDGAKTGAYAETDATNPLGVYGASKLCGEEAIAAAGGAFVILRSSWVYDSRGRNFVRAILKRADEHGELRVVDDQIGSPTWALAIAEATCELLADSERARAAPGVYHFTAAGSVSRYDLAARILEKRGGPPVALHRVRTADIASPAQRPLNCVLDVSRLEATFGISLPSWETQLDRCLAEILGEVS
jgi:dTDP-4-dehydrorhamnose reductase